MCSHFLIAISVVLATAARADTPDIDQEAQVDDETAATATRVHLTPHLDLGFGLRTGVLGAGLEAPAPSCASSSAPC